MSSDKMTKKLYKTRKMENEIWKDIDGFEGRYKISNKGRVYSIVSDLIMKQCVKVNSGYKYVHLSGMKNKSVYVHRLVAINFVPNPENKPEVNHINGIKAYNSAENLQWVTHQENIDHSWENGLLTQKILDNRSSIKGSRHGNALLTEDCIPIIRKLKKSGKTQEQISLLFGVSRSTIRDVLDGRTWSHI